MSPRLVTRATASAVFLAMATTTAVLTGDTRQAPTASSTDAAIVGATLHDGTGAPPLPDAAVVIRGDRIIEIGRRGNVAFAAGTTIIDARGRHIVPGFVDTHAHVTVLDWRRAADGAVSSEYRPDWSRRLLSLMLAFGITTVRNPGAPDAVIGVALRDSVARGWIPGPRIVTAGNGIGGGLSAGEVRREVRAQAAADVDLIKLGPAVTPAGVAAAVDEAHRHGLRVMGHLQRTSWTEGIALGIDAITHGLSWSEDLVPGEYRPRYQQTLRGRLDWLGWLDVESAAVRAMVDSLAARRIVVDPTLIAYHTDFWGDQPVHLRRPERALLPELEEDWRQFGFTDGWSAADFTRGRALWPKVLAMIRLYHERGVPLAIGSDVPNPWVIPGLAFHDEMGLIADVGIPVPDILAMATRNGARAAGVEDSVGTLQTGKFADFVLLRDDPSRTVAANRTIDCVWKGGMPLDPSALLARAGVSPAMTARMTEGSRGCPRPSRSLPPREVEVPRQPLEQPFNPGSSDGSTYTSFAHPDAPRLAALDGPFAVGSGSRVPARGETRRVFAGPLIGHEHVDPASPGCGRIGGVLVANEVRIEGEVQYVRQDG